MRLLDSNIVIYATAPQNEWLRLWLEEEPFIVSIITRVEVLGFHRSTAQEKSDLQDFLLASEIQPLTDAIAERAIALRQQRNLSLGDSLLAATALEIKAELVTRNMADFLWIDGLQCLNPFEGRLSP